ncbi:MAG: NUDIX domain-containing protein, partial [Patescibacteria group bacterium]
MDPKKLFKVVITAIVVKDGKYLVLQRAAWEKKFPSRWTVPGGKLDTEDYIHLPKDTPDYWYNVLERTLRREVKEEAGIEISNIRYVTSLADAREGDDPSLVISCLADYASGEVVLDESMTEFRWVNLEEAKDVDLIEGIYEELEMA